MFDVFNGDADGICALHQWRLCHPAQSRLVTGTKRDIRLLRKVTAAPGDTICVFDISLDTNRTEARQLLAAGVSMIWFDHHFAGEPLDSPRLQTHICTAADTCTSLIVDRVIEGRYRAWAVVAAFGDNLRDAASKASESLGRGEDEVALLAELGELMNYNGYGDSEEDLHIAPADLYRAIAPYPDPFDFIARDGALARLREGFASDMRAAEAIGPCLDTPWAAAFVLPDRPWARRIVGTMANRLATANPARAHALLVPNASGAMTVSVRSPKARPEGADTLCRKYASGGGRKAAAGINQLPTGQLQSFLDVFLAFYAAE